MNSCVKVQAFANFVQWFSDISLIFNILFIFKSEKNGKWKKEYHHKQRKLQSVHIVITNGGSPGSR